MEVHIVLDLSEPQAEAVADALAHAGLVDIADLIEAQLFEHLTTEDPEDPPPANHWYRKDTGRDLSRGAQ